MKLADYLIQILRAHAMVLERVSALLGEDDWIEILEGIDEDLLQQLKKPDPALISADRLLAPNTPDQSPPWMMIEGHVREFGLAARLEFYLWSYPYYRVWIESELDLHSEILRPEEWITEAIAFETQWLRLLPIRPQDFLRVEQAVHAVHLKLRASTLERAGVPRLRSL
jgi:hypothetical protein